MATAKSVPPRPASHNRLRAIVNRLSRKHYSAQATRYARRGRDQHR